MYLNVKDFETVTVFLTRFPIRQKKWDRSSEEKVGFEINSNFKYNIPPQLTVYQAALAVIIVNDSRRAYYKKRNGRTGVTIETEERYFGEWEAMVEEFLEKNKDFNKYAWFSKTYLKADWF